MRRDDDYRTVKYLADVKNEKVKYLTDIENENKKAYSNMVTDTAAAISKIDQNIESMKFLFRHMNAIDFRNKIIKDFTSVYTNADKRILKKALRKHRVYGESFYMGLPGVILNIAFLMYIYLNFPNINGIILLVGSTFLMLIGMFIGIFFVALDIKVYRIRNQNER